MILQKHPHASPTNSWLPRFPILQIGAAGQKSEYLEEHTDVQSKLAETLGEEVVPRGGIEPPTRGFSIPKKKK